MAEVDKGQIVVYNRQNLWYNKREKRKVNDNAI